MLPSIADRFIDHTLEIGRLVTQMIIYDDDNDDYDDDNYNG
jgi:hypothetical protein